MATAEVQAIIFDSDGTLVDSEPLSLKVLCEMIGDMGVTITLDQAVQDWAGADLHRVFREIESEHSLTLPETIWDDFRARQMERLATDVLPIAGAAELLQTITKPRCVASNAPVIKVELCLKTTGLLQYFEPQHIFSAYQVEAWKPDPAVFLYAAKQLNVAPENCAVVEDSVFGIEAARAAGMTVFAYDPHDYMPTQQGVRTVNALVELKDLLA